MKNFVFLISLLFTLNSNAALPTFQHPEGKYYKINGARLWVETVGNGDPLFLISGGPGGAHHGLHSFDALKDSSTLIYIDNFGRGKSDTAKSADEYSIERDVRDIEALREAMQYDKINLLGHSYGSIVVQLYAIRYPQHVKHLIIANGFFSGEMWQESLC